MFIKINLSSLKEITDQIYVYNYINTCNNHLRIFLIQIFPLMSFSIQGAISVINGMFHASFND